MKAFRVTFTSGQRVAIVANTYRTEGAKMLFFAEINTVPVISYHKKEVLMIEDILPEPVTPLPLMSMLAPSTPSQQ